MAEALITISSVIVAVKTVIDANFANIVIVIEPSITMRKTVLLAFIPEESRLARGADSFMALITENGDVSA